MDNQSNVSGEYLKEKQMDSQTTNQEYEQTVVVKVIDGDTFIASDGRRIRLIGVDTPEYCNQFEKFGVLAKKYTTDKLFGKMVWMERDVSDVDYYARFLRIVWLQKPIHDRNLQEMKDKMFNAHLLIDGFALATPYFPDIKYRHFFSYFAFEAKKKKQGLWDV